MSLLEVFLVAVGLAMDAFAVSLATGCTIVGSIRPGHVVRMAGAFGLFQALMPVAGWYGGRRLAGILGPFDHWVALGLLGFIGVRMIVGGIRDDSCEVRTSRDQTRGILLLMLALATSIDALAVGLTIGVTGGEILLPSIVIGLVAAVFSVVGLLFGRRLGCRFGSKMEILGGLVLVGIGIKVVVEHLMKSI